MHPFFQIALISLVFHFSASAQEQKKPTKSNNSSLRKQLNKEEITSLMKKLGYTDEQYQQYIERLTQYKKTFQALTKEQQESFLKSRIKAAKFHKEKRITESIYHCFAAEQIFNKDLLIKNILGANYVELRVFPKAIKAFNESIELRPYSSSSLFNLGEVHFVTQDYQQALTYFKKVKTTNVIDKSLNSLLDIIEFKIELCHLGLSKDSSLDEDQRSKHLKIFTDAVNAKHIREHKLHPYYAFAALAFSQGDEEKAQLWIKKARFVFPKKIDHSAWFDTLLEFGYISEIYNKDKEKTEEKK